MAAASGSTPGGRAQPADSSMERKEEKTSALVGADSNLRGEAGSDGGKPDVVCRQARCQPVGGTAVVCRQTRCRLIHRPGAQVVPRKGEKALSNLVGPFRNLRWTRSWGQQLLWVRLSFSVFYAPSLPDPLFYPIQSTLCLRPSTPSTLLPVVFYPLFCIFYLFFVCMSTS